MDDSSIVWEYVSPVDSVRVTAAQQGQGLSLQGQGQDQGFDLQDQSQDQEPELSLRTTKAKDNIPADCMQPLVTANATTSDTFITSITTWGHILETS